MKTGGFVQRNNGVFAPSSHSHLSRIRIVGAKAHVCNGTRVLSAVSIVLCILTTGVGYKSYSETICQMPELSDGDTK